MRKLLTVTLALVFVLGLSGLAWADFSLVQQFTLQGDNESFVTMVNGGNYLHSVQDGDNTSFGHPVANYLKVDQFGSCWADLDQFSNDDNNWAKIRQGSGSTAWVRQVAKEENTADVYQAGGGNVLVGAHWLGAINFGGPATQISNVDGGYDYNYLKVVQTGGSNVAGLYQHGDHYNYANISQTGGGNTLGSYQYGAQTGGTGFNYLLVTQNGSDTCWVHQYTPAGNNTDVHHM